MALRGWTVSRPDAPIVWLRNPKSFRFMGVMLQLKNLKDHITITMSLLTCIKINASVINAEECFWLFTNVFHPSFDSE